MSALYILGAGTPTPTTSRFGTCYVLEVSGEYLMIDCGPATTYKLIRAGLFPTQVDYLFFTHHHFDHNADYPCFLLCRWEQSTGTENKLQVWGPEPTERITEQLIGPEGAFAEDWQARVGAPVSQQVHQNRGGSLPRPEPSVQVADIAPGYIAKHEGWEVTAAQARHVEPWLQSVAYRFEYPGGSIVFAGDTEPCETITELAAGAAVLVVNCWDHQATMEANGEAPGQTGTLDAARMAQKAGVDRLILTHIGPALAAPDSRQRGVADIAALYSGEIIFAEELTRIDL